MEKQWRLKRIDILSAMKTIGTVSLVTGGIVGFILGSFGAVVIAVLGKLFPFDTVGAGIALMIFAPVVFACIYGIMGAVITMLVTVLYNLVSGITGGVTVDFDDGAKHEFKLRK